MAKKEIKKTKTKRLSLKKQKAYYSGFCFTDNLNFAFFNVSKHFLVDNDLYNVLSFKLNEDDLWMLIDRTNQIIPSKGNLKVTFKDYGMVDRKHFDMIISINPNCQFYPVTEWFGKSSNRLIVGLPEKDGKPIGILKTVK